MTERMSPTDKGKQHLRVLVLPRGRPILQTVPLRSPAMLSCEREFGALRASWAFPLWGLSERSFCISAFCDNTASAQKNGNLLRTIRA